MVETDKNIADLTRVILYLMENHVCEKHIIETLSWEGHLLDILDVIISRDGKWYARNESRSITGNPTQSDLQERYYWGVVLDDELSVLVDVPCSQERLW